MRLAPRQNFANGAPSGLGNDRLFDERVVTGYIVRNARIVGLEQDPETRIEYRRRYGPDAPIEAIFAFTSGNRHRHERDHQRVLRQDFEQKAASRSSRRTSFELGYHVSQHRWKTGVKQAEREPVRPDEANNGLAAGQGFGVVKRVAPPLEFEDGERATIDGLAEAEAHKIGLREVRQDRRFG